MESSDRSPQQSFDPLDVSNWIEGAVVGGALFVAQIVNTLWLMSVAPRYIIQVIESNSTHRRLIHPFTFLLILILPVALALEYWELPQVAENLAEPLIVNTDVEFMGVIQELQELTPQEFFLQTAPTALLVVGLAFVLSRLFGDRKPLSTSPLVAVTCYVVGYRLFIRLCQAGLNLLLLPIIPRLDQGPAEEQLFFALLALCLLVPIAGLTLYGFFVAGWPTMYAALRQWGSGWLVRYRWTATLTSGLFCFVVYVPSIFTPALIGMVQKFNADPRQTEVVEVTDADTEEFTQNTDHEFSPVPDSLVLHRPPEVSLQLLDSERLVYDGQTHKLAAPLVIRNPSTESVILRVPQQVKDIQRQRSLFCQIIRRDPADKFQLLEPGSSIVWQLVIYLPHGNTPLDSLCNGLVYSVEYLPSHSTDMADYTKVEIESLFSPPLRDELASLLSQRRIIASGVGPRVR